MEEKKTAAADLENERTTFFLLGFIVVLATLFVVFEWSSEKPLSPYWEGLLPVIIEEEYLDSEIASDENPDRENPPETPAKELQIITEGFNIVAELPETEEIEIDLLPEIKPLDPEIYRLHDKEIEDVIHSKADVMPQFNGGNSALVRFIYSTMVYPPEAEKQKIQGKVWCSFIVNENGSISDVKIENGFYPAISDEAIRVLRLMPDWIPGIINQKAVRVKVYVPIVFKVR
jgi:protein TonB